MAVLSVPEDSAVPGLPEDPAAEFPDLVADASGCRPDGEVREMRGCRAAGGGNRRIRRAGLPRSRILTLHPATGS
ncbi:hypothetical protein METH_05925 [Leisingera methylohalidivorans DSM 14336]|uniref:Uncharacterized protein n=1 Tax=Leisingera methylohalidivorans DSM 14336 TaxID=999552 RepID=V9VVY6_9RHOB|nr:hypothetical protein METH_05925 [Leisingera methylohalidivorans DSM 14336]